MIGGRGMANIDGGVERAVACLSRELVALGQDVTVYSRSPYSDGLDSVIDGVKQIPLPCLQTKHLEALTHSTLATLHATPPKRYDVLHFHAVGPAMFSVLPRLIGRPTIATVHALDYKRDKWGHIASSVLRRATWIAARVPTQTIAVSRELADHLRDECGRAASYIPNGVDLPAPSSETPISSLQGEPFILFLGRLVPEKGIDTLIRAFRSMETAIRLAIVGDTSHSDAYVSRLVELAAGDPRITFLGSRVGGEKLWLLRNTAAFVQPSTVEGLPIALLEALACGAPTVISDIRANVEVVESCKANAGVFPVGDESALRAQLEFALAKQSWLAPKPDFLVPPSHSWPRIAEQTLSVYRSAVNKRATASHFIPA
jgi:glycosyltransferase involved in cell wall biosynthesis